MARPSKDDKLIADNPGLSAYELLTKGLSEKRYEELLAIEKKAVKQVEVKTEKLVPVIKESSRALPKLTTHVGILMGQARVKSPDGKVTPMDRARAVKFVEKQKKLGNNYKIID